MNSTKTLKLGWLIPYSGIFRNLKHDLVKGFQTAFAAEHPDMTIESYPEFIQTGGQKPAEDALKKLLLYEQVDLVIGVLSSKVVLNLLPQINQGHTPLIFMNLGADIPVKALSGDLLFYNSMHLWKSQWSLGRWAQNAYGGEPAINMSLYESGYGLHESFKGGIAAAGASTLKLNVTRSETAIADITPLIDYINDQRPSYAHVLLSGREGTQFLQELQKAGLDIPLTTTPYLTTSVTREDIPPGIRLHSAATWFPTLDSPANWLFHERYIRQTGETPNSFSLLAYETGLVLAAALQHGHAELAKRLKETNVIGPRGEIGLSTSPLTTAQPTYIWSTTTGADEKKVLEQCPGREVEWDHPSFINNEYYTTGWQNPYLCV